MQNIEQRIVVLGPKEFGSGSEWDSRIPVQYRDRQGPRNNVRVADPGGLVRIRIRSSRKPGSGRSDPQKTTWIRILHNMDLR